MGLIDNIIARETIAWEITHSNTTNIREGMAFAR